MVMCRIERGVWPWYTMPLCASEQHVSVFCNGLVEALGVKVAMHLRSCLHAQPAHSLHDYWCGTSYGLTRAA
jgi:hypothetical protein